MRYSILVSFLFVWVSITVASSAGFAGDVNLERADPPLDPIPGRIIATGIPGAGAVAAVGYFHPGGPIQDKADFVELTQSGMVLDKNRVLVASSSNFGAPLGHFAFASGTILSIDPRVETQLSISPNFAFQGGQASTSDGFVQTLSAQTPSFLNSIHNSSALTSALPAVSNPLAISINNAFGRPWIGNAPGGLGSPGTLSVIDPTGAPLNGAPNPLFGGVFSTDLAQQLPQRVPGSLSSGVVGTALLGKSPDGSGRAVFAAVLADGSVTQVHVEKGVDGLAPEGSIAAIAPSISTRAGVIFNWVPEPILFVADPTMNAITAIFLSEDGQVFHKERSESIQHWSLNNPVDLAPAISEIANPGIASNTTLAGGSDFYVANRGNGTIVRMKQNGRFVAMRQISLPGYGLVGPGQLNGIAVSPDAKKLWATITGSVHGSPEDLLIELPVFSREYQHAE